MILRLVVILGPTASGKSSLAIKLARQYNGEVISADSRQVYKGFNITSGKVTAREMHGIRHHLLDVAKPKRTFTVAKYQRLAHKTIRNVLKRGKLPILCGGTGLYIQSVVDGIVIPEVKPNHALRKRLGDKSTQELFRLLERKDPERATKIDSHNPRRLIRALEIIETLGKVPPLAMEPFSGNILLLGIKKESGQLKKLIRARLLKRMRAGMIPEIKQLHKNGLSWKHLENLGLEYRYGACYLQGKITKREMATELERAIIKYAKRQMTWFKRDKRIHWISDTQQAFPLVKKFLKIKTLTHA